MKTKNHLKLEDELERETYYTNHISSQKSIDYLIGYKKGLAQNQALSKKEREFYLLLCDQRIEYLKDFHK